MSTLEQLIDEAEELYPTPSRGFFARADIGTRRAAHVRAKTISAEQLEEAAEGVIEASFGQDLPEAPIYLARAAFEAAGFYVEEEQ